LKENFSVKFLQLKIDNWNNSYDRKYEKLRHPTIKSF